MFSFLNTKHKRKSAAITSVLMSLLLIVLFFVGMTYLDPPEEYGIAVNFGTSDVGQGNMQPKEPLAPAPEQTKEEIEEVKEEVKEEIVEESTVKEVQEVSEEVATQENEEAIAIKKAQEVKKKADEIAKQVKLQKEKIEREKQAAIAQQKAEEAAKRKKIDGLIGGVSNSEGTASGGEGNDNEAGDKGKITGDPYAPSYFGNGGSVNGGVGYGLNGRGIPSKTSYKQDCNEYGVVIVRIEVDRSGKVIKATPVAQGSTNNAPCLTGPAEKIALSFKWPADANAPTKQIGFVSVNFEY